MNLNQLNIVIVIDSETQEWVVRGGKGFTESVQKQNLKQTIDRFCDTSFNLRPQTPEQDIRKL